jgi:hypothetical protein
MAETIKKAKAPAKPRKTATKTTKPAADNVQEINAPESKVQESNVQEIKAAAPSREQIAELARKYWAERGWKDGYAEQDWLRAEQELRGMAS